MPWSTLTVQSARCFVGFPIHIHIHIYLKANATAASPLFLFVGGRFTVRQPSRGVVLGHLGGILEASRGILGASWRHLGASWGILGASWRLLGASWGHLGGFLGLLGASWGILGASWRLLGASWGQVSAMTVVLVWNLQRSRLESLFLLAQKANHHYRMDGRFGPKNQSPLQGAGLGPQNQTRKLETPPPKRRFWVPWGRLRGGNLGPHSLMPLTRSGWPIRK